MTARNKIEQIRATIDALIQAGTTLDLKGLDRIYHRSMKIHMIDTDNNLTQANKPESIAMLKDMLERDNGTTNTWAEYNSVEADGDTGHVLITRKVSFGGADRVLVMSIDLVFEDARWQVIREVIFARPNPEPTPA